VAVQCPYSIIKRHDENLKKFFKFLDLHEKEKLRTDSYEKYSKLSV
jgi:hypothetical protein